VIEFVATQSAVLERDGRVRVGIRRYGKLNCRVLFRIETIDGTAEAEKDYIPIKQTMVFERDETHKSVDIEIIDDNEWEPDEVFFVKLALDINDPSYKNSVIGKKAIQEITIINDDEPGTFEFAKPSFLYKESAGKALIPVERTNGADGKVEVKWKTEDMSAHAGKDYEAGEGTLVFDHGEMTKMVEITLHDDQEAEKDECFRVELLSVSEGAKLGRVKKTIISIVNDDDFDGMVSRLVDMTNMNMDQLRVDSSTWGDQFRNAMNVNGGDIETATNFDYIMHFLTFGWKLIFALVPPPSIWGGWLSFFIALMFIGVLTAIVGDLASIFGCLVSLGDSITAITFVALGTSLPDLFASKQAATQEKTADNSIGNVTGSNSVNVFLGLGLPWFIAALYWTAKGETFEVQAGSLGFSVTIYTICAVLCVCVLLMRRFIPALGGGELGGPVVFKWITFVFFVLLWFSYILLSSLQVTGHIKVNF
jgi:solute carrier family 8 (sodium/calcium exchanger)